MHRCLAIIPILLLVPITSAWGAYAFLQSATSGPSSGLTATVTINGVAQGSLLVLAIRLSSENRTTDSVSDGTNSWSSATTRTAGSGASLQIWKASNVSSGNFTITATFDTSAANTVFLAVLEYSGIATTSPQDVNDSDVNAGTTSSVTTGPITTTQDTELIFTAGFSEGADRPLTTPSGFTQRVELTGATNEVEIVDKRQTTSGSQSVTWEVTGGNGYVHAHIVAFKESAVVTPLRSLLGVGI